MPQGGTPPPHYETLASSVSLTIRFQANLGYLQSSAAQPTRESEKARRIRRKILDFCTTPRSATEILEMLQMKDKKWVRQHYLLPLLNSDLELTIPEIPNSRQQKYRTKETGNIPPSHPPQANALEMRLLMYDVRFGK